MRLSPLCLDRYRKQMRVLLAFLLCLIALPLWAAESAVVRTDTVEARILTAEDGVAGQTLSAGLDLRLAPGWKTYWRSPGEVGLPPELDWSDSENVAGVDLAFPAPERFTAFEIENYGYSDRVVFPLTVQVSDPSAPVALRLRADLLVCAELCIPESLTLSLDLPASGGIDMASAELLADWVARVPGTTGFSLQEVHVSDTALTLTATSDASLSAPVVFPELGLSTFGAPEIVIAQDGRGLWAQLPILYRDEGDLDLTLVDGARAATLRVETLAPAPPAPAAETGALWRILVFALLGGLILNVMPCVLPVLSIKIAGALEARDRAPSEVRAAFLTSAAGILTFFAALAGILIAARAAGVAVGWGIQFQQPVFLALMAGLMLLFAANLFGAFEFALPGRAQTAMGTAGGHGRAGDFANGAFAAVMATPCSAPFLGTAVAYALTQSAPLTLAVFLAMGVGLALPYIAVALFPASIRWMPRPGAWMTTLKSVLGVLMLLAAVWVLWVLWSAAGSLIASAVAVVGVAMFAALLLRKAALPLGAGGLAVAIALAAMLPQAAPSRAASSADWAAFAMEDIGTHVAGGAVVFVDVTADWCLTCQVNKRLVLDREPVDAALADAVRMQADWTRPNQVIADYLAANGRYGIPFNIVYGPGAPEGIALPELLTDAVVLDALARAAQ